MDLHRLGELRSIAYHRALAARLDDAMRERTVARIRRWRAEGLIHPELARQWMELLGLPLGELAARLVADDPRMARLRSSSPFAGELPARERWQLWRDQRAST